MIYWIKAGDTGAVKVGFAVNVAARFRSLQCGAPYPLVLLRTEQGTRATEAALHKVYAPKRVLGEWFLLDENEVQFDIARLTVRRPIRDEPLKSLAALRQSASEGRELVGMDLMRSKPGSLSKTAKHLGITKSACSQWLKVPAELVVKVELATGIRREMLRPDLYDRGD